MAPRNKRGIGAKKKSKLKIEPLKTIGNLFKKGKKAVENVNPNSEINKKINKKTAEIKDKGYHGSGKERAQLLALKRKKSGKTISQLRAERETKIRNRATKINTDFQAYKKGNMSLSEFIKKNPTSNTAREANKKGSALSRKLKRENNAKLKGNTSKKRGRYNNPNKR
tara:strand:+ start:39 stop:542 length:504 start_codon:yes stop_codon:yes gene_type:complete